MVFNKQVRVHEIYIDIGVGLVNFTKL